MIVSVKCATIKPSVLLLAMMMRIRRGDFMSFLSSLFKKKPKAEPIDRIEMLRQGYKENFEGEFFPPDTVWTAPGSKVYHALDHCTATGDYIDGCPLPESEAIRQGLRRCKRCEWLKVPNGGGNE